MLVYKGNLVDTENIKNKLKITFISLLHSSLASELHKSCLPPTQFHFQEVRTINSLEEVLFRLFNTLSLVWCVEESTFIENAFYLCTRYLSFLPAPLPILLSFDLRPGWLSCPLSSNLVSLLKAVTEVKKMGRK